MPPMTTTTTGGFADDVILGAASTKPDDARPPETRQQQQPQTWPQSEEMVEVPRWAGEEEGAGELLSEESGQEEPRDGEEEEEEEDRVRVGGEVVPSSSWRENQLSAGLAATVLTTASEYDSSTSEWEDDEFELLQKSGSVLDL